MKGMNRKSFGIAILIILSLLAVVFYFRADVKSFVLSQLRIGKYAKPEIVKYTDRFSQTAADTGENSLKKLAATPWPMFRYDPMHTGRSPFRGPEVPTFQWEVPTRGLIESSPAVGPDGTVYIGSHDFNLYAFTPAGILKWKFPTLGFIRSSPAVSADGTIYIGSTDGHLYAVAPAGHIKWSYFVGDRVLSSPTIRNDGSILIISSGELLDPDSSERKRGVLHAVSDKGERIWKTPLEGGVSVSSPTVLRDGTIYQITYPGILFALDPQGNIKWQSRLKDTRGVRTTPAVAEDGTLYFGARSGVFYAVNPDGSVKWTFETNGDIRSSAAISKDGTVYFGSYDNYLYALHSDGRLKWKFKTRGPIEASPCVDSSGAVYFSSLADQTYALNNDGSLKWNFRRGFIYTSPVIGPDGTMYDSGDTAVRAIGTLLPTISLTEAVEGIKIILSNKSAHSVAVDVRVWARNSSGEEKSLFYEKTLINGKDKIERSLASVGTDAVVVGARLLDTVDGGLLSEKLLFLNKK